MIKNDEKNHLGIIEFSEDDKILFEKIHSNLIDLSHHFENIPPEITQWVKEHPDPICEWLRMARLRVVPQEFSNDMRRLFNKINTQTELPQKMWSKAIEKLMDIYIDFVKQRKALGVGAPIDRANEKLTMDLSILLSKSLKDYFYSLPIKSITIDHMGRDEKGKIIRLPEDSDPLRTKKKMEEASLNRVHKDYAKEKLSPIEKDILKLAQNGKTQDETVEILKKNEYKISQPTVSRMIKKLRELDLL